jgi:hypothetical protein
VSRCTETRQPVVADVPYDGLFNRTETDSQVYGGSLQLSAKGPLGSLGNLLIAGASFDGASSSPFCSAPSWVTSPKIARS